MGPALRDLVLRAVTTSGLLLVGLQIVLLECQTFEAREVFPAQAAGGLPAGPPCPTS